jgi:hypothetical protein
MSTRIDGIELTESFHIEFKDQSVAACSCGDVKVATAVSTFCKVTLVPDTCRQWYISGLPYRIGRCASIQVHHLTGLDLSIAPAWLQGRDSP